MNKMKTNFIGWLILNLVSIIFAVGSLILAFHNIDGWGWFLIGSLATYCYPAATRNSNKEENVD